MAKKEIPREIEGCDLVDMTPDYTKTADENRKIIAERYKAVYGVWPPWMAEGEIKLKEEQ